MFQIKKKLEYKKIKNTKVKFNMKYLQKQSENFEGAVNVYVKN